MPWWPLWAQQLQEALSDFISPSERSASTLVNSGVHLISTKSMFLKIWGAACSLLFQSVCSFLCFNSPTANKYPYVSGPYWWEYLSSETTCWVYTCSCLLAKREVWMHFRFHEKGCTGLHRAAGRGSTNPDFLIWAPGVLEKSHHSMIRQPWYSFFEKHSLYLRLIFV